MFEARFREAIAEKAACTARSASVIASGVRSSKWLLRLVSDSVPPF